MLIPDLLRAAAAKFPDKDAARFPEGAISFGALDRASDQVATRMRAAGVAPGDRVALLWDNALDGFVYFWGALKAGAQNVDLPGLAGKPVIEGILAEARPKALTVQPRLLAKIEQDGPLAHAPSLRFSLADHPEGFDVHPLEQIRAEPHQPIETEAHEDDVALVVYTSGTSGRPKGVMLSHRNLISNISAANELMGLTHDDSIFVVVPTYFIHGRMQILLHAMLMGTLVFASGFHFPKKVVKELAEAKTTGFSGVPYHYKSLMKSLAAAELPDLKYALCTGGALSFQEWHDLQAALPGVQLHNAYGQTEASPRITYLGPEEVLGRKSCAGVPLPGVVIDILDEHEQPLPPGEVGEVAVGGPGIMKGYVSGDELESGRIDAQGRLRTGDLGKMVDGYLYLVGRKSDMMKVAGERVFPQEIEEVLNQHDAIRESAVLNVPDPRLGEKLVALVVLHKEASIELAEMRQHCLKHMSFVRVPKAIEVVDELPKTGSGKLHRSKIKELIESK